MSDSNKQSPSTHLEKPEAKSNSPTTSPSKAEAQSFDVMQELRMLSSVFNEMERGTAIISEKIFEPLIDSTDEEVYGGKIKPTSDPEVDGHIKILNKLFPLSKKTGFKVINPDVVKAYSPKIFTLATCFNGLHTLRTLCDIVNEENKARTPNNSPEQVSKIEQAFPSAKGKSVGIHPSQ